MSLTVGCVADSKEIGNTAGGTETESGQEGSGTETESASESESMSSSQSTTESTTTSMSTTITTSGSESTTDGFIECEAALSEGQCNAASGGFQDCAWFPTTVVVLDNEQTCTGVDLPDEEGVCILTERTDSSCGDFFESTCPDGSTAVWYNVLGLEIGAVELYIEEEFSICDQAGGGFEKCILVSEDPLEYDPPECACGCPL